MSDDQGMWWMAVVIVVCMIGFGLVQPYFEMKAFNKFSTQKATYFDAMFSQLRVINVK